MLLTQALTFSKEGVEATMNSMLPGKPTGNVNLPIEYITQHRFT